MRVVWTDNAKARLHQIHDYIATQSLRDADAVISRLIKRSERLQAAPHSGRKVPEYAREDVRELLVRPYRIIYLLRLDRIDILSVMHYRQLLPSDVQLATAND